MKINRKKIFQYLPAIIMMAAAWPAYSQETTDSIASDNYYVIIPPLFDYPTAPEEIEGLQAKSDWLMDHFWDGMDFKNKTTVDQNALNDAFRTYVTPLRFADNLKAEASVKKLLTDISKNGALSWQFAKAAEEALYGPRAEVWNDDIFLLFIDNVLKNKNIKKDRKQRYERLGKILRNSKRGSIPPEFDYITIDGKTAHYHPNGIITVLFFGDPSDSESRYTALRLSTEVRFSKLVELGKINVLYVISSDVNDWQKELDNLPANWHAGKSGTVIDQYDLRITPALYVIDREGKVAAKNINVDSAMQIAASAAEQ